MLNLVLENVTLTSRAAEAPRIFTTDPVYATALMKDRMFTLLGSVDDQNVFNLGNLLSRNQKVQVWQYLQTIEQKFVDEGFDNYEGHLARLKHISKNIELSGAPGSAAELAGGSALILLPVGRMIMIYYIMSPFDALMSNHQFKQEYHHALMVIHAVSRDPADYAKYIEETAALLGYNTPSYDRVALENVHCDNKEVLARAFATVRLFGIEE